MTAGVTARALEGPLDAEGWERLVAANPASGFMQSLGWAELKRRLGYGVHHVILERDGQLAGGAIWYSPPGLGGPCLFVAPHGPVLPWHDPERARTGLRLLIEQVREIAPHSTGTGVRIEPLLARPLPRLLREFRRAPVDLLPNETLWLDLRASAEDLLCNMKPKCRYNIRLAKRRGVEVHEDTSPAAANRLHAILTEVGQRNGMFVEPVTFFIHLAETLAPRGMLRFLFAHRAGVTLGGLLLLIHGSRATYLYGGTATLEREAMAGYALQWAAIRLSRNLGCHTYDFYGYEPFGDPTHPYAGFSRFKRQFGGTAQRFAGAQDLFFIDRLSDAVVSALHTKETIGGQLWAIP
jgi:lipid II:glycine glycyltransferase (peptidoglycan interpeptide bridge formation enzyme)